MSLILIRYGELALKSHKVRRRFEEQLMEAISRQFERHGIDWVMEREQGRIFLHTSEANLEFSIFLLQHMPGIFSVSPVQEFEIIEGMETVVSKAADFAKRFLSRGNTFAVRARRAGSHSFTSQEAAALSGERILETIPGLRVKLKDPDVTIHLEIRGRRGFLFTESHRGMGGVPQGSQGRVVLLLSGSNSMAAGFLLMKRGCTLIPLHFTQQSSARVGGQSGNDKEQTWERELERAGKLSGTRERPASVDEVQKAFKQLNQFDHRMELIVIDNEIDTKIIHTFMEEMQAHAVVVGSKYQDPPSLLKVENQPVFYPLIGLNDHEIEAIGSRIEDFYQRSIEHLESSPWVMNRGMMKDREPVIEGESGSAANTGNKRGGK